MTAEALAAVVAGAGLALAAAPTPAQTPVARLQPAQEGTLVTRQATGTFEVKLAPQQAHSPDLGRMTLDKQFHGDLEAVSVGEMLSAMTAVKGSAGYVAMELVRGTLHGKQGTFVLQHSAFMIRGTPDLTVTVVPDSGTGELTGLTGRMQIIIEAGGGHSYRFEYTLPGPS
jgi:hypothetical protein